MVKITGIYLIENKTNQKKYIGRTVNIHRRFMEHKCPNYNRKEELYQDIRDIGLDNFEFTVVEECASDELNDKEMFWIDKLKPEYNRTLGGAGVKGISPSEETRAILREAARKQWESLSDSEKERRIKNNLTGHRLGYTPSDETKQILREKNLGKKQSVSTKEKRKATFAALKAAGKCVRENGHCLKKVLCIETGVVFESVKAAAESIGTKPTSISSVLKGRYNTCKNYHFQYCSVETNRDECSGVGGKREPIEARGI